MSVPSMFKYLHGFDFLEKTRQMLKDRVNFVSASSLRGALWRQFLFSAFFSFTSAQFYPRNDDPSIRTLTLTAGTIT